MKVYIELLFLDNFVMNMIILLVCGRLAGVKRKWGRLCVAAATGGVYACFMFALQGIVSFIAFKILVSFLMCLIAFYRKGRIKNYFKTVLYFYLCTFVMGGAAYAFLSVSAEDYLVKGGIIVGTSLIRFILFGLLAGILLMLLFLRIYHGFSKKSAMTVDISIGFMGKMTVLRAFLDTGNALREPLSGLPVIIAESESIKEVLPENMALMLKNGTLTMDRNETWQSKVRIMPVTGVAGQNGVLYGFKPDSVKMMEKKGEREILAVIAVTDNVLNEEGAYHALVGPEALV